MDIKREHIVFSEQYVIDWNATRAYQVAYPDCTDESAKASASRLLTDVNVSAYIDEIQKDLSKLAGVSALGNILELKKILTVDEAQEPKERAGDRIKALEVINKMLGFNAPDKTEVKKTDVTLTNEEREQMIKDLKDKL